MLKALSSTWLKSNFNMLTWLKTMYEIFIANILKHFIARYSKLKICPKTNLCTTEFAGLKKYNHL